MDNEEQKENETPRDFFLWYIASGTAEGRYWAIAERKGGDDWSEESDAKAIETIDPALTFDRVKILAPSYSYRIAKASRGVLLVKNAVAFIEQLESDETNQPFAGTPEPLRSGAGFRYLILASV